tara:strand:+ start:1866 stop:2084 length:219 start_codon:yes stop_codon:yes gene_type:complete
MKNRIEGHTDLYKDPYTGVIVNRAKSARDRYKIAKQQALKNIESQKEVASLRNEISEVKLLLKQLLEEKNGN